MLEEQDEEDNYLGQNVSTDSRERNPAQNGYRLRCTREALPNNEK